MSKEDIHRHELKEWTYDIELILKNISEKCQIWRELHMKTHSIFKNKYYRLTIPVIVLSSITGGANLSLGSISTSADNNIINLVIGAVGIIISILSTLNNIFSFSKRKDEHYRASNDWYRLHRLIKTELSLERNRRIDASKFFNMVLLEIERIHDYQPNIRNDVLNNFKKSLRKKGKTFSIEMPEIIKLSETLIYKTNNSNDITNEIHKVDTIIDIPDSTEEISSLSSSHLENDPSIDNSLNVSPVIQKNTQPIQPMQQHIGPVSQIKKEKTKEQMSFNIQKYKVIDIDKPKIINNISNDNFTINEENGENIEEIETITKSSENKDEESEKTQLEQVQRDLDTSNSQQWNSTRNLGNLINKVISNVSYRNN